MITTHWTQYLLPHGRQKAVEFDVDDDLAPQLAKIKEAGCRLECEILTTGQVSLTVFDPETEEDRDIVLCRNGPGVVLAIEKLIRRFPPDPEEP